ncbi:hypothetical protein K438DRAFT_1760428 [Mycena galopus ATCC 62051]|nr:hypothetical protein K438DRAFT_1760428 [Mycena galopus ATCC 62051]
MAPKLTSTSSLSSAAKHATCATKHTSSAPAQDPPDVSAAPAAMTTPLAPIDEAAGGPMPNIAPTPTAAVDGVPVSAAIAVAAALLAPPPTVAASNPTSGATNGVTANANSTPATTHHIGCELQ